MSVYTCQVAALNNKNCVSVCVCVCFVRVCFFFWMTHAGQLLQGNSNLSCHFSWQRLCHYHRPYNFCLSLPLLSSFVNIQYVSLFYFFCLSISLFGLCCHVDTSEKVLVSCFLSLSFWLMLSCQLAANCTLVCQSLFQHYTAFFKNHLLPVSLLHTPIFFSGFQHIVRVFAWFNFINYAAEKEKKNAKM